MYGEKYGVPRDIYAKIKIIGLLILDIAFVGITGVIALSVGLKIFPKSQWIQMFAFIFLTPVLSLYLVLPANGGKKELAQHVSFLQTKKKTLYQLKLHQKEKTIMAIKQTQPPKNEKRPLGRIQETKKQTQEYFDLHSCVELLDVKSIIPNSQAYIQLVDYGYLQLMEIPGKDLGSMSYNEVMRTIENFETWLTRFGPNIQVETTTLPTNTDTQISDLRHHLDLVRQNMSKLSVNDRRFLQLKDREIWLQSQIKVEESIRQEVYNTEFILWLFAPTTSELDELVRKAKTYGNNDFVPQDISYRKKIQIIKQYNNMNEKV